MNLRAPINKDEKGFTIIEVMIVLAIAGLIILIVFLAVPALQRNSRNTQRKNDVAAALSAVAEYATNRNGAVPTSSQWAASGGPRENAQFGYYTPTTITLQNSTADVSNPSNEEAVLIVTSAECNGTTGDASNISNSRRYVALYTVETGGGSDDICQEG